MEGNPRIPTLECLGEENQSRCTCQQQSPTNLPPTYIRTRTFGYLKTFYSLAIALILATFLPTSLAQTCTQDYVGTSFSLAFPGGMSATSTLELHFRSTLESWTLVTVEIPKQNSRRIGEEYVRANNVNSITLSGSDFQVNGNTIDERGIRIFTQPVDVGGPHEVTVTAILKNSDSTNCAGFQLIPEEALGTDYYTLTWDPTDGPTPRQNIGIAAFNSATNLEVNLASGVSIVYNGITYNEGTPLRVTIERWETFHIIGSSGEDFSGTRIRSNNNVAVYTGVISTQVGVGVADTIHEQMLPVPAYGFTYIAIPFDNNEFSISFVSSEDQTNVQVGSQSITLTNAGDVRRVTIPGNSNSQAHTLIQANKPIQLAQFSMSQLNGGTGPSAVLLPAREQWLTSYSFNVPTGTNTRAYVVFKGLRQIFINDAVSGETQRFLFDESNSIYYGSTINLLAGRNTIYMSDNEPFSVILFSQASPGSCLATYTAGQCLDSLTGIVPTPGTTTTTSSTTSASSTSTTTASTSTSTSASTPLSTTTPDTTTSTTTTTTASTTSASTTTAVTNEPPAPGKIMTSFTNG